MSRISPKGLLTSHSSMTLERLHGMLKLLFVGANGSTDGRLRILILLLLLFVLLLYFRFDMNIVQLRQYLQVMVDHNAIDLIDGLYFPCKK